MSLRSWREVALSALVAAMAIQTYEAWAAQSSQLGFFKSWAIEDPAFFWTVHLGTLTTLVLALLALGRVGRLGFLRAAGS